MSTIPLHHQVILWLSPGEAAAPLNISTDTLTRYADRDAVLVEGRHVRRGLYAASPRVWEALSVQRAMARRRRHEHHRKIAGA